jgi:hypothetical protein
MAWLALALTLTAGEPPLAVWDNGGSRLTIARDGSLSLADAAGPVLSGAGVMIFGPNWQGGKQDGATVEEARADGDTATIRASIVEVASGKPWRLAQTVTRLAAGWRVSYELRPTAAVTVNEVSWIADLPIDRFAGKQLALWPDEDLKFPVQAPADHHFVAAGATRYLFDAGAPGQLTIDLDRARTCNVQDTRQWQGSVYQAFVKMLDNGRQVGPDEVLALTLTLKPHDATVYGSNRPTLVSAEPLKLAIKSIEAAAVGQLATCHVDLKGAWQTPFWQEQVALDATITAPDGRVQQRPGFFTQAFDRHVTAGSPPSEVLTPAGAPEWQVRFLPELPGAYQLTLTARDRSGTATAAATCQVAAGARRPWLRVSPTDHQYFEFDDARPYFANGCNICWAHHGAGSADYEDWFSQLAAAGGNYARVWMPSWGFGFEWGPPGSYRLDHAAQFDQTLAIAQDKGVYLKLTLESFRTFEAANPYAKANGGPCATVLDVFRDEAAQRMWRNRLRYIVARWGWSPNLLAYEQWNEINCVEGYQAPVVQAWERRMCAYLKQLDPRHLTVSSLGSFVEEPELWRSPELDFAQIHGYWHPTWHSTEFGKDMAQMVADHVAKIRGFGKPAIFAEFGLVDEKWGGSPRMADDPDGVHLHNGCWAALMAGAAGTAHLWWWDNYIAPRHLWSQFRGIAGYVADVPFTTAGFEPVTFEAQPAGLRATGLKGRGLTLVWLQNRAHTWWNVAEKHPIPPVSGGAVTVPGAAGRTVEVWDTGSGQRLRSFAATGDTLTVGEVATDVALKIR